MLMPSFTGGKSIRRAVDASGEPWRPEMKAYETAPELGVYDMWQIHRERTGLAKMYLDRWNACSGLDIILGGELIYTRRH
jgi:amidase